MKQEVANLREVVTKVTRILVGEGVRVTQQGSAAFVKWRADGVTVERVNLPMLPDDAPDELIIAIEGFLDHEVGHVLFTKQKAVLAACTALPKSEGKKLQATWNMIEDIFVERKMAERFRGSAYNIDCLHEFFLDNYTVPALTKAKDPREVLATLMVPAVRAAAGQPAFERFMSEGDRWSKLGVIGDVVRDMGPTFANVQSTQDSIEAAREMIRRIEKMMPPDADEQESDESGGEAKGKSSKSGEGKSGDKPSAGGDPGESDKSKESTGKGGKSEKPAGAKKSTKSDDGGSEDDIDEPETGDVDADDKDGDETTDDSASDNQDDAPEVDSEKDGGGSGSGELDETQIDDTDAGEGKGDDGDRREYPEVCDCMDILEAGSVADFGDACGFAISKDATRRLGDSDYNVFTKDYDRVERLHYAPDDRLNECLVRMEEDTRHMVGQMQKHIERVMASRSRVINVGGHRSGRLHGQALHRLMVGDDRVFRRKEEHKSLDVAVTLVVDCSGSMGGEKINLALDSAYALSATLERVGIKHEVIGFTTSYKCDDSETREARKKTLETMKAIHEEDGEKHHIPYARVEGIYMPIFKEVTEKLNTDVKRRMAYGRRKIALSNNIDGESVEIAALRLLKRHRGRKVMMVLSDGWPQAVGDMPRQARKLKDVVKWCETVGIETVGIGIQSDAVKHFYDRHIVIKRLEELPGMVMGELQRILGV